MTDGLQIRLLRGTVISGVVKDIDGNPVESADVLGQSKEWMDRTVSMADGSFMLVGLQRPDNVTLSASLGERSSLKTVVDVSRDGLSGVELVLSETRGACVAGRVVDPTGKPMQVRLTAWGQDPGAVSPSVAVSTSDGRFLLTGLSAGPYTVLGAVGTGKQHTLAEISLSNGQRLSGVTWTFPDSSLALEGRVLDANRRPLRATISYMRVYEGGYDAEYRTRCRPDGTFRIDGVEEGEYELTAAADGYVSAVSRVEAGISTIEFVLEKSATLSGTVVDARSGAPLTTYQIAVRSQAGRPVPSDWRTIANANGTFELPCEPGDYMVFAKADGYRPERYPVTVRSNSALDNLTIRLVPGESALTGTVLTADKRPVAGAAVFTMRVPGPPEFFLHDSAATSNDDGTFRVTGLFQGPLTVTAFHPTFGTGSTVVEIGSAPATCAITLQPPGHVHGQVTSDGEPVVGINVLLTNNSGSLRNAMTQDDGTYQLDDVEVGPAVVTVTVPENFEGSGNLFQELEVIPGQSTAVNFELSPADNSTPN